MWTGELYLGSQGHAMNVIFDSASDWLIIEGSECGTCEGNVYDISKSATSNQVQQDLSQRAYGVTTLTGLEWTDQVCFSELACIQSFEFFLVYEQNGFREPIDGILGLARNYPFLLSE